MISLRNVFRIMAFAGAFMLTLIFIIPVHADFQKADAGQNTERFSDDLDHRGAERSCPSESLFNPYTGNCAKIRHAKPLSEMRARSHAIQAPPSLIELRKHKGLLRNKAESFLDEDEDIYVPGGIGAGIAYRKGCLQALMHGELHTRMFVHPDGVNPSFPGLTWLFSTATNRTQKSIEVAGLYQGSNPGWLGIFDWSCSNDYPCQGGQTDGSWIWTIHFSDFPCNMTEIEDQGGHFQKVMQYANQTIQLDDSLSPLWRSAVYLWNFCNDEWDLVYDHEYRSEKVDCSKDNSCAWWGPILETFDDPLPRIKELGFEETLLLHDGNWSMLPPTEADFRDPSAPWVLFHIEPNRGFGAGNYVERYVIQNDLESFVYRDDVFYGTDHPAYASGAFTPTDGYEGTDGLHVVVGNVDFKKILDGMSGGWSKDFELDRMSDVQIGLKYRLMTSRYDTDECGEALVAVDGDIVKHLATLCGRGLDTGWKTEAFTINLPPGIHTLTVGAYNNKKTGMLEKTDAYFDDISVRASTVYSLEIDCGNGIDDDGDGRVDCDDPDCADSPACANWPLLIADFDGCGDDFVYADDTFYGTNQPRYASGICSDTAGISGSGGLHLALGNVDTRHILDGISGGWTGGFRLSEPSEVEVGLDYRLVMTQFDADECANVLAQIDNGPVEVLEELCGRGKDTGWKTITFMRNLDEGDHTITIGGYNNKKTGQRELAEIYFDNLLIK